MPRNLIDISVRLAPEVPVWPGDTPYSCTWHWRREQDASVNLSSFTTSPHAGTHADAPLHIESNWPGAEGLPPEAFVGAALVITVAEDSSGSLNITAGVLDELLGDATVERVLVRTGFSVAQGTFPEEWPALDIDAAAWLVERGVRLFGVDAPSVDRRSSTSLEVHHVLLENNVYVLENLNLRHVAPGHYELLAQPLLIHGADAAPVRALLRAIS